tara:strand:+ start:46 stop:423 length:378 start_codon:yes stop_codon:yes gene_type:complete
LESQTPSSQSTDLNRDKKSGVVHWWSQRISALILAPLMLWFIFSALSLVGADHAIFVTWLSTPINTAIMALLVVTLFFHSQQGMKVIVEDYIHNVILRSATLLLIKIFAYICVISSLLAIFLIAL